MVWGVVQVRPTFALRLAAGLGMKSWLVKRVNVRPWGENRPLNNSNSGLSGRRAVPYGGPNVGLGVHSLPSLLTGEISAFNKLGLAVTTGITGLWLPSVHSDVAF